MTTRTLLFLALAACGSADKGSAGDTAAPSTPTTPTGSTGAGSTPTGTTGSGSTPTGTSGTTPTWPWIDPDVRRHDCSGIEPADPAPLGGRVALTFDDGPHPTHTPAILDVLRAHDVPATFFVLGDMVSQPDAWPILEDIRDDPRFEVGNHSWSHPDIADLSYPVALEEIDATTALLETFDVDVRFFRFPYGSSTCATHDLVVDELGMVVTGWHVDTVDWCYAAIGAEGSCLQADYWRIPGEYEHDMMGFVREQVARSDGGVILMHDIHGFTARMLDDLITTLEADGYRIVPLSDLDTFPLLNAGEKVDLPWQGEACDLLDDRCWEAEYFAWCEPLQPDDPSDTRGVCVMPCEGLCPDRDGAPTTFCATVDPGAGLCVGRAGPRNSDCADVPGAVRAELDRWIGGSSADPATAEVCVPPSWAD